jgi:hypothetical protein
MEKKEIRDAYIKYWLENGKRPVSIYTFAQQLNIPETTFYDNYASFEGVEKDIWLSFFAETLEKLRADETYKGYSVREKLLAFYFLWVQELRGNRSYILRLYPRSDQGSVSDRRGQGAEIYFGSVCTRFLDTGALCPALLDRRQQRTFRNDGRRHREGGQSEFSAHRFGYARQHPGFREIRFCTEIIAQ